MLALGGSLGTSFSGLCWVAYRAGWILVHDPVVQEAIVEAFSAGLTVIQEAPRRTGSFLRYALYWSREAGAALLLLSAWALESIGALWRCCWVIFQWLCVLARWCQNRRRTCHAPSWCSCGCTRVMALPVGPGVGIVPHAGAMFAAPMAPPMAPGAPPPLPVGPGIAAAPIGQFVLVQRGAEWDEMFVVCRLPGYPELLCITTCAAGSTFVWVVLRMIDGATRVLPDQHAARTVPAGAGAPVIAAINWMCVPPALLLAWAPTPVECMQLQSEGLQVAAKIVETTLVGGSVAIAGSAVAAYPEVPAAAAGQPGPGSAIVQCLAGGAPLGAAVLGGGVAPVWGHMMPPAPVVGVPVGAGAGAAVDLGPDGLNHLQRALDELRLDMERSRTSHREVKQERRKEKKKKERKHKKDKKSRSASRSGDTSRRTSRSRSTSSSSSSSFYARWNPRDKKTVRTQACRRLGERRFKGRDELLTFAARRPGALSGYFMSMVYEKLHDQLPADTREMRRVDITDWAKKYSGATETRDVREITTIAAAMSAAGRGEMRRMMDILTQRVLAIQQAKTKGSTWEKAQNLELIAREGAGASVPSGMLRLAV